MQQKRKVLAAIEGQGPADELSRRDQKRIARATRREGRRAGRRGGGDAYGGYDAYGMQSSGRRMQKVESRLQTKVDIATRLEMLKTDGLIWVVLLNADQGGS